MISATRNIGPIVVVAVVVVAFAIVATLDMVVRVRPQEVAVVEPFSGEPYLRGPGRLYKWPFLDSVTLINTSRENTADVDLEARLSDGSSCSILAKLVFQIVDPMRFVSWRRANDLPANAAIKAAFSNALLSVAGSIDPDGARDGAIERWVFDYQRENAGQQLADGVALLRLHTEYVACSDIESYSEAIENLPEKPSE